MEKTYKKFKIGALILGAGVTSILGGVACDTVHGAPIGTNISASAYGLNAGWVFRGTGHHGVSVFTKNYPTGIAVAAFDDSGNVKCAFFFEGYVLRGFDASQLDPAIAHLFPDDGFIMTDFSFRIINGVKNVTLYGVNFVL